MVKAKKYILLTLAFIGVVALSGCASLLEAASSSSNYTARAYSSLYVENEISIDKKVIVESPMKNSIMKRVTEVAIVDRLKEYGVSAYAMSSYSSYSNAHEKDGPFDYAITVEYGDMYTYTNFGGAIASIDFECTVERIGFFSSDEIAKIVGSSISRDNPHTSYAESIEPACKRAGEAIAAEYLSFIKKK